VSPPCQIDGFVVYGYPLVHWEAHCLYIDIDIDIDIERAELTFLLLIQKGCSTRYHGIVVDGDLFL